MSNGPLGGLRIAAGALWRMSYTSAWIFVVTSLVCALALLPIVLVWTWTTTWSTTMVTRVLVLSLAIVPSYALFALALMLWSAAAMRLTGTRTPPDQELPIAGLSWPLMIRVRFMVSSHLVRVVAGGLFRGSPLWTAYLHLNGAASAPPNSGGSPAYSEILPNAFVRRRTRGPTGGEPRVCVLASGLPRIINTRSRLASRALSEVTRRASPRAGFVTGVRNGFVEFDFHGWHQELYRRRIRPDDVRWAGDLVSALSDRQLNDAFRADGFPPALAHRFIGTLRRNIAAGQQIGVRAVVSTAERQSIDAQAPHDPRRRSRHHQLDDGPAGRTIRPDRPTR